MKKQVLLFILALLPVVASAETVSIKGVCYNLISKGNFNWAEIVAHPSHVYLSDKLILPTSVEHEGIIYNVTTIAQNAFRNCHELISIYIPNSVTTIGSEAFAFCNKVTSIVVESGNPKYDSRNNCNGIIETSTNTLITGCNTTIIPENISTIANYAFSGCSSLTSVNIPNSVTSIGKNVFYYCYSLTSVNIGNGVTSIGENAFYYCGGLTTIVFGYNMASIGNNAFKGCSNLKKVIVKNIATWCNIDFTGSYTNPLTYAKHLYSDENTEIKNLVIPNTVTSIGNQAFQYCSDLTSVTIPNSVTSIGSSAFSGCTGLTSVAIPNSVTSIGSSVFSGCTGLTSVAIPNSVKTIDSYAFSGCSGLTSVTIGKHVNSIRSSAFANCKKLTDVYCFAEKVPNINTNAFENSYIEYATLHIPSASVNLYKAVEPWKNFKEIVALETTDISQSEINSMQIQSENGRISISGTGDCTAISVFGTNGVQVGSAVSRGGQAVVNSNLPLGSIAIVKIGEKSVKVVVK